MFFVLISCVILFGLLTGYFGIQEEWVLFAISGVLFLTFFIILVIRDINSKKKNKKDSNSWTDCLWIPDCMLSGAVKKLDCGDCGDCGGDCGGIDCSP